MQPNFSEINSYLLLSKKTRLLCLSYICMSQDSQVVALSNGETLLDRVLCSRSRRVKKDFLRALNHNLLFIFFENHYFTKLQLKSPQLRQNWRNRSFDKRRIRVRIHVLSNFFTFRETKMNKSFINTHMLEWSKDFFNVMCEAIQSWILHGDNRDSLVLKCFTYTYIKT